MTAAHCMVETSYAKCLIFEYMTDQDAHWADWMLYVQGPCYVRDKAIDQVYGLLNKDWSDWRNGTDCGEQQLTGDH